MNALFRFVFGFFFLRFGGGGSSSGETKATEAQGRVLDYNLGKLQESDALRAPYMASGLTGAMGAYDKYSDPAYANRMLGQANTDAMSSLGTAQAAMGRNMSRYGAAFNPNRMANESANIGLQGAALRTGAMNSMRNQIDDKQTTAAVNKYKLLNDMSTDSMSQGNQIAGGLGQMGNSMAQNAQAASATQSANMGAVGQLVGAGGGLKMAGAWKDGGRVGFANGGRAGLMDRGMEGMQLAPAAAPGPSPTAAAADAAGTGAQAYKMGKAAQAANAVKTSQAGMLAAQEAGMGLGTAVGSTLAPATAEALAAGATAAGTGAAATGAAATGAAASGVGTVAAANAWNPVGWILGAAALFGAANSAAGGQVNPQLGPLAQRAELFAQVFPGEEYTGAPEQNEKMLTYLRGIAAQKEVDGTAGGQVTGPGTKTSDSVPANLSRGEYVVNADAVEQPGVLPALEAINQKGLQQRQNLASGGLAGFAGGLAGGLTMGYNLGTQYLDHKDKRAFRDANAKAVADARAEADASGGRRTIDESELVNNDGADQAEKDSATEFARGLSAEDYAVAKEALAAEEGKRLDGVKSTWRGAEPADLKMSPGLASMGKHYWDGPPVNGPVKDERPAAGSTIPTPATTTPYRDPRDSVRLKASDTLAQPAATAVDPAPVKETVRPGEMALMGTKTEVNIPKKSAAHIYASKYLPALQETLVGQGKLTESKALGEWAQDRSRAEALDHIGAAMTALDTKDTATAAKHLTKFYNGQAMPDGMFAVVKPGKNGTYTIQQFDDKTGKLVNEISGDGEALMRQSIGYLTGPDGVVKFAVSEYQAKRTSEAALAKEQRGYTHAEKLEGLKASNATPTQLEKYWGYVGRLRAERAATTDPTQIKAIDEQLASADAAIKATGTNQFMALMNTIANTSQDNQLAAANAARQQQGLQIQQAKYGDDVKADKEKKDAKAARRKAAETYLKGASPMGSMYFDAEGEPLNKKLAADYIAEFPDLLPKKAKK